MYLSQKESYSCPNPLFNNTCPPVQNCCPPPVQNCCPSPVVVPQVVYQPYYVQQPYPIDYSNPYAVQQPHPAEYQRPLPPSQTILPTPQLQYNWTPSNVYNMRWPIRR